MSDYSEWLNRDIDFSVSVTPFYSETRVMKIQSMRHLAALCGHYTRAVSFYPANFFVRPLYEENLKKEIENTTSCKKNIKMIKKLEKYLKRAE